MIVQAPGFSENAVPDDLGTLTTYILDSLMQQKFKDKPIGWRHDSQHNDIQHNDTQRNDTQHNDNQPNGHN